MEDNEEDFRKIRKQLRRQERLARKAHKRASAFDVSAGDPMSKLEDNLLSCLPSGLIPGNVGSYESVAWPFSYTVQFDFGNPPLTITPNTRQTQSFQVTQEAAFICGEISRKCLDGSTCGELAPWQILIKDRQSTRQFMDFPIPLQAIAKKTPPTVWEVPLIIMPSAFIDVEVSTWIPNNQFSGGQSTKFSITFSGYRTRTSDIGTVLSTIFGRG